jgi:hypothetical protein
MIINPTSTCLSEELSEEAGGNMVYKTNKTGSRGWNKINKFWKILSLSLYIYKPDRLAGETGRVIGFHSSNFDI